MKKRKMMHQQPENVREPTKYWTYGGNSVAALSYHCKIDKNREHICLNSCKVEVNERNGATQGVKKAGRPVD